MPEPAAPRYDGIRAPLRPSANGAARPPPASSARQRPTRIARIRMGLIIGIGALIVLVVFIAQNAHAVYITFFGAHASVSLAAALLAAAVAGALVGAAASIATARIAQNGRIVRRSTAGRAHLPVSGTHRDRNTAPGRHEPRPKP